MSSVVRNRSSRFLLLCLVLFTTSSGIGRATSYVHENPRIAPVDIVQVVDLPINIQDAVMSETKKGYVLKCSLSNNADSRILGVDYLLLLVDSNNTARGIIDGSEELNLEPNASKRLISRKLLRFEFGDGYHLILIPQRVFSTYSFWEVVNARKVLEKYASGDYSLKPEVARVTNLVDTPIGGRVVPR